jgi:hypothetical protein
MYPVVFYAPFPVPAAWTVEDIAARLAEQGRVFLIAVDNGAAEIVGRFPHAKELLKSSPLAAEKRGSLRLIEVTP